jgi:hypothetical protein
MIPAEILAAARDKSILDVARQCGAQMKRAGAEWNGPCPACGGRDRFWVDEVKNVFLCRMSGAAGDGIALLQHQHNCSFSEAVGMLVGERAMPAAQRKPRREDDDNQYREKARRRAWAVWQAGRPIEIARGGHLVARYLALRGIAMPDWRIKALREIDQLAYWHAGKGEREAKIIHKGPAMLAAITGPDGHFIGVHRTWLDLTRPNGKATIADPETGEILNAKKVEGSQRGGKIVLRDLLSATGTRPQDEGGSRANAGGGDVTDGEMPNSSIAGAALAAVPVLALGEGIETVLSWAELHPSDAALWVGINLDNIAGKAAGQIPHPSLTTTDRLGRVRKVKIGNQEPDLADARCLHVPVDDFERLVLLGDGDSDRYATQAAMLRGRKRFQLAGHDVSIDWAPDGSDWNDVLKDRGRREAPLSGLPAISPARGEIGSSGAGASTTRAA